MDKSSWVAERAKCSIEDLFSRLESMVKDDVAVMNKLSRDQSLGRKFEIDDGMTQFIVRRSEARGTSWKSGGKVEFVPNETGVVIKIGETSFSVHPGLNDAFECITLMEGVEVPLWRVSQRALGDLFFRP